MTLEKNNNSVLFVLLKKQYRIIGIA